MTNQSTSRNRARTGATIMEVMFAIGVLLFGLLGIASVIPVAGRMARMSMNLDRGTVLASRVASQFEAFGFNNRAGWITFNNTAAAPAFIVPCFSGCTPATDVSGTAGTLPTACLDPLMLARPEVYVLPGGYSALDGRDGWYEPTGIPSRNYYQRRWFPYYAPTFNPLVNPMLPVAPADQWPVMPRLPRTTLATGRAALPVITSAEANLLIADSDELVTVETEDDTLPLGQHVRSTLDDRSPAYTMNPVQRSTEARYTWMATINPTSATTGLANIVVFYNRSRDFSFPLSGTPIDPDDPVKANAAAERVCYVNAVPSTRFVGGAGGSMQLVASQAISTKLSVGDWIMLIRSPNPTATSPIVNHAWYRVLFADREAQRFDNFVDPVSGTSRAVWSRNVTVEGPDWDFGFGTDTSGITIGDNTLAVIVSDVVAVKQFPISF